MEREAVWDVVRRTARTVLEVEPERVHDRASFVDDLAVDSLALVEYAMVLEDELHVELDEQETSRLRTVGELVDLLVARTA